MSDTERGQRGITLLGMLIHSVLERLFPQQ